VPFKDDLKDLMNQFAVSFQQLAQIRGVAGVVLGVVYHDQSVKDPTDEVALLIVPQGDNEEKTKAVCHRVANALVIQIQGGGEQVTLAGGSESDFGGN
jgi:hypothetical protein